MTSLCKISLFRTLITINTRNITTGVKILPLWPGGKFLEKTSKGKSFLINLGHKSIQFMVVLETLHPTNKF